MNAIAAGNLALSPPEVRVLGCLLEKQRTTPDLYPLTLNGLRLACNQSTNRDPVLDYDDAVIREALHRLERRGLARLASGAGSRAPKYRHLTAEALPMSDDEQAVLCVLMLRGPQTPGELKQRADRMYPFADLNAVQHTLEELIRRGLAVRLDRRPGQKEERFSHLLSHGAADASDGPAWSRPGSDDTAPDGTAPDGTAADEARAADATSLSALAARVARLEREVAELRAAAPAGHSR